MTAELKEAIEYLKEVSEMMKHGFLSEAIDTVLSHINTVNKKGLDDRLQEKSIEVSDSQEGLSYKKDRIYTDKDMESFAEWCNDCPYALLADGKWSIIDDNVIVTTAQLREMWEQERRAK